MTDKNGVAIHENSVVQITDNKHPWFGCIVVVKKIRKEGIQAFAIIPDNSPGVNAAAFINLSKETYEYIGHAVVA